MIGIHKLTKSMVFVAPILISHVSVPVQCLQFFAQMWVLVLSILKKKNIAATLTGEKCWNFKSSKFCQLGNNEMKRNKEPPTNHHQRFCWRSHGIPCQTAATFLEWWSRAGGRVRGFPNWATPNDHRLGRWTPNASPLPSSTSGMIPTLKGLNLLNLYPISQVLGF